MRKYSTLLVKSMYRNVDAELLWLRLLDKYLVNKCDLKRSKSDSYIYIWKYEKGKLELVMLVHVDDVFMADKPETV